MLSRLGQRFCADKRTVQPAVGPGLCVLGTLRTRGGDRHGSCPRAGFGGSGFADHRESAAARFGGRRAGSPAPTDLTTLFV